MKNMRKIAAILAVAAVMAATTVGALVASAENTESASEKFTVTEAASDAKTLTIPEIAAKNRRSVVAIETEDTVTTYDNSTYGMPFGGMFGYGYGYGNGYGSRQPRQYTEKAAGSGVIISQDGYIVTNNHVISGAEKITVYVPAEEEGGEEKSYEAKVIASSESNDIAVLKIDAADLVPAAFGNSDDLLVGEVAVVIGNPMGTVHGSVTAGIISATEQKLTIDDVTINAIQTDAAVNPGNSGGALFNAKGELVGIVYAKSSSVSIEGIGYAIPINQVRTLVEQMVNDPASVQAQTDGSKIMLGLTITDVTEDLAKQYSMPVGIYITEVSSMSAAERAGLQRGDIITSFAGETVKTADELNAVKAKQTPGDIVKVVIDRNGQTMTLDLVIPQPTANSTTSR